MLVVGFFNQKEIEAPTLLNAVILRDMQQRRQLCLGDSPTRGVANKLKFVAIVSEAATRNDAEAETFRTQNNQSATVNVGRMEHVSSSEVFDGVEEEVHSGSNGMLRGEDEAPKVRHQAATQSPFIHLTC